MSSGSAVRIRTADGPMPAYRSAPFAVVRGGVVVIHEAFGITRHIEEIVERLAEAGHMALAPALFHRVNSPVFDYDDIDSARQAMSSLTPEGLDMDISAVLALFRAEGLPRGAAPSSASAWVAAWRWPPGPRARWGPP